ncbi:MAG: DUF308 domain-containing protein [Coprococcus sp.]|nr:DUF308 domain-containing protein [Coprococcus sp.]
MKVLKQNGNVIIMCIIEVVIGILLLVNPVGFTTSIIMVVGIALMVDGLLDMIRYFRSKPEEAAVGQLLMRGLIALLAGAFCTFYSQWFIATFPVIAILYGIAVLIVGMSKVQIAMDMLRLKNAKWWWGGISAVISIICAIVIINNPFSSTVALWWFTGISLIAEAIFDIITLIMRHKSDGSAK